MADIDIGDIITDVFNGEEVRIGYVDGADTKFFGSMQEIKEHWEKLETQLQTALGTVYIFHKNHNNFVEWKMAITRVELALLHGFNNDMLERTWVIRGTDEDGQTTGARLTFTGKLPIIDKQNVAPGAYIATCRIRVTQKDVTVS